MVKISSQSGQTLIELLLANLVTVIVMLGLVTAMILVNNHYNALIDQNAAEQALLEASYYLKIYAAQGVKLKCYGAAGQIPQGTAYPGSLGEPGPGVIQEGFVACDTTPAWLPDTPNALGLFIREDGRSDGAAVPPFRATSIYRGTGIYFTPPSGSRSGVLSIASADPGGALDSSTAQTKVDHLVNIRVVSSNADPSGYLKNITYKITGRYFLSKLLPPSYDPGAGAFAAAFKEVETTVTVIFRNNRVAVSALDGLTSERPSGGLYFYKPSVALMGQQQF